MQRLFAADHSRRQTSSEMHEVLFATENDVGGALRMSANIRHGGGALALPLRSVQ